MSRQGVILGAILLCIAIVLGAMAAHGLTKVLSQNLLESFEKGVRYQFYAGFSLLILGLSQQKFSFSLRWFNWLTLGGVILFSGCIYLYCFHEQLAALKPLVYLVPFGGVAMISAWIIFIIQMFRAPK